MTAVTSALALGATWGLAVSPHHLVVKVATAPSSGRTALASAFGGHGDRIVDMAISCTRARHGGCAGVDGGGHAHRCWCWFPFGVVFNTCFRFRLPSGFTPAYTPAQLVDHLDRPSVLDALLEATLQQPLSAAADALLFGGDDIRSCRSRSKTKY